MKFITQIIRYFVYRWVAIPVLWSFFLIFAPHRRVLYRERSQGLTKGVLIVPNHLSHLDPPLIGVTWIRPIRFLAKAEPFQHKFFASLIQFLGAIPLNREGIDRAALEEGLKSLYSGKKLCLFAEGTRGDGNVLNPLNPGIAFLAKKSGVPVLPMAINGTQNMLPRGSSKIKKSSLTVVYGQPFTYKEVQEKMGSQATEKETKSAFMEELKTRMIAAGREAGLNYE